MAMHSSNSKMSLEKGFGSSHDACGTWPAAHLFTRAQTSHGGAGRGGSDGHRRTTANRGGSEGVLQQHAVRAHSHTRSAKAMA